MPIKPLKNKIFARLLIILIFPLIGLALIIFFNNRRNFYLIQNKNVVSSVVEKSSEINQIFECSTSIIQTISVQPEIANFLENSNPTPIESLSVENTLRQYNINNKYKSLYLMDNKGNVLISTLPSLLNNNFSFRQYFIDSMAGKTSVDFNIGTIIKQGGFYFSAPVFDASKKVIGVVVANLEPEVVSNSFVIKDTNSSTRFSIVDNNGVIVGTNDNHLKNYFSFGTLSSKAIQNIKSQKKYTDTIPNLGYQDIQNLIDNYSTPTSFRTYNSNKKVNEIIGISKISNHPFYIIYSSDISQVDSLILLNTVILLASLTVISIIMFVFFNWTLGHSLSPLSQLKQFAISVSQGNFDQTIELRTGDEIEELAHVFNETTLRLKNMYQNLAGKINEKTSDLSSKLQQLEDSKKAIFNLLEDAEIEKKKSVEQANDLQKFKLAVDSASDQIVIFGPDHHVLYANKATEKITGYSRQEIIGQTAQLWAGPQYNLDFIKKMEKSFFSTKKSYFGESTNTHKDGTVYIAEFQIHPVFNENDEIIFYVDLERDITKAKEIENMKNDFISVASHQLRTPLGSMRWNLEMLLAGDKGKMSKPVTDTIQEIYGSDTRMITLVNDLLNVSRIDQGRVENNPVDTLIVPIIEESIKEMDYMASKKSIKINFDKKDLGQISAKVDPKRFREVMQNLLSNAVKYNKTDGSVTIKLNQDGKETNISVSDTGIGISKKDQSRLFTKFFRASNAVLSETEGSGLGLSVVKSFVESWGGTVTFTSEENKGSTFIVKLPIKNKK